MTINNSTTDTGSLGYASPALVDPYLIAEVRETSLAPLFVDMRQVSGSGLTVTFPLITTAPTVAAISNGSSEAAAQNVNTVVLGNPTVTLAVKMSGVVASYISLESAAGNLEQGLKDAIARALANKMDIDALDLLKGFSNTAGTSGVDLSLDDFRAAMVLFKRTALGDAEMGVACLHPQQIGDMNAQMISGSGAALSSMLSRADLVDIFGATAGRGALSAYQGNLMGVPLFSSSNVPANGTTDWKGAIFVPKKAIGGGYKWLARLEEAPLGPTLFQAAKGICGTSCYGFIEIDDNRGVTILSDY